MELFHPTLRRGTRHGGYVWVVVSVDAIKCIAAGIGDYVERQGKVTLCDWGPHEPSGVLGG